MTAHFEVENLRRELATVLDFRVPPAPPVEMVESASERGYARTLLTYGAADGDLIPAYLLVPDGDGPFPAVVVHHQHNSEHHLGKSEPAGLAGDELQAFGPALARRGVVVLAPDSICFEDRRRQRSGRERDAAGDPLQHYNEFAYRLVTGDLLARKVLADSALAVSMLMALDSVHGDRLGLLGHSYGGNTVLFHAPLDERVRFACARARPVHTGPGWPPARASSWLRWYPVLPSGLTLTISRAAWRPGRCYWPPVLKIPIPGR